MNPNTQLLMMIPGTWIVASITALYTLTKLGIHIHSNTAAIVALSWLGAAPLALIAAIVGCMYYSGHWSDGRGPKVLILIHAMFLAIAVVVAIGILNLPDFRGQ